MASIKVKQISSSFSVYEKYVNQCLRIYTAFCIFIPYVSKLRMRVVKTIERQKQSADDCLHIFVHRNVVLPWVYDTHA